jgi:hypothetical protein
MSSDASENLDIFTCSTANASLEVAWVLLDLMHCLQLDAAHVLLMTLHITELALDTFGLVLGRQFVFK